MSRDFRSLPVVMKRLGQLAVRTRAAARRLQALTPVGQAPPVRLVLRLNETGVPDGWTGPRGEPMDLHSWQRSLVLLLEWLGPVRVVFAGGEPAGSDLLSRLVRFCNRLECPTHLVTGGGLTPEVMEELVDWGLAAATVQVASLEDGLHKQVVGTSLDAAASTLAGLSRLREDRGRPMRLMVGIPLVQENLASVGAIAGWARQCGADGVFGMLPPGAPAPEGAAEALKAIGEGDVTPGALVRQLAGKDGGAVPIGWLLSDGSFVRSQAGSPVACLPEEEPGPAWSRGAAAPPAWLDAALLAPKSLESRR